MLPMVNARKPPPPAPKAAAASAGRKLEPQLRSTEVPGVYRNGEGLQVDERGVLLSLKQVTQAEADHDIEILGAPVSSPAELLKRVALDPSLPLHTRLSAAIAAAPYFDRKMPTALEGGDADRPIRTSTSVTLKSLSALEPKERKAALDMLEKLGVL